MLRDKSLIPLSRQHQHALALCVRIDRASPIDAAQLEEWQAEIAFHFESEIKIHFVAEEQIIFPASRRFSELNPLVDELLADHQWLRERFARCERRDLTGPEIGEFAQRLSEHIRKEERQLFQNFQELEGPQALERLGQRLDKALEAATQACALPRPKL